MNDWQETQLKQAENKVLDEMKITRIQRFNSVTNRKVKRKTCKIIDLNIEMKNYWKVYSIQREKESTGENKEALESLTKTIILRLHNTVKKDKIYGSKKYIQQVLILDQLLFRYEVEDIGFISKTIFEDEDIPF